jgi:hypothetical protein
VKSERRLQRQDKKINAKLKIIKHHRREGFTESVPEGNKQTLLEGGMKKTADIANDPSYTRPPV